MTWRTVPAKWSQNQNFSAPSFSGKDLMTVSLRHSLSKPLPVFSHWFFLALIPTFASERLTCPHLRSIQQHIPSSLVASFGQQHADFRGSIFFTSTWIKFSLNRCCEWNFFHSLCFIPIQFKVHTSLTMETCRCWLPSLLYWSSHQHLFEA